MVYSLLIKNISEIMYPNFNNFFMNTPREDLGGSISEQVVVERNTPTALSIEVLDLLKSTHRVLREQAESLGVEIDNLGPRAFSFRGEGITGCISGNLEERGLRLAYTADPSVVRRLASSVRGMLSFGNARLLGEKNDNTFSVALRLQNN